MFNTKNPRVDPGAPEKGGPSDFTLRIDFPIGNYLGKDREEIAYAVDRAFTEYRGRTIRGLYEASRPKPLYSTTIMDEIKRWDMCGRVVDRIAVSKDVWRALWNEMNTWDLPDSGAIIRVFGIPVWESRDFTKGTILFCERING